MVDRRRLRSRCLAIPNRTTRSRCDSHASDDPSLVLHRHRPANRLVFGVIIVVVDPLSLESSSLPPPDPPLPSEPPPPPASPPDPPHVSSLPSPESSPTIAGVFDAFFRTFDAARATSATTGIFVVGSTARRRSLRCGLILSRRIRRWYPIPSRRSCWMTRRCRSRHRKRIRRPTVDSSF